MLLLLSHESAQRHIDCFIPGEERPGDFSLAIARKTMSYASLGVFPLLLPCFSGLKKNDIERTNFERLQFEVARMQLSLFSLE